MCNCGKKRSGYSQETRAGDTNTQRSTTIQNSSAYNIFEYTGKTALTVIGNSTGIKYRFSWPGDTQNINQLDTPGMMSVRVLKKIY